MNAETEVSTPETATSANQDEIKPIKKQHGGKRPGAGRKRDVVGRMVTRLKRTTAAEILQDVDPERVIREIFSKGSLSLKQRTLADLWDRAFGRPAQNLNVAGSVALWTPDLYAHLTDEEVAVLARLTRKPAPALPESAESTNNQAGNQE